MPGKPSSYQQAKRLLNAARTGATIVMADGTVIGHIVERSGDWLTWEYHGDGRVIDAYASQLVGYVMACGFDIRPKAQS